MWENVEQKFSGVLQELDSSISIVMEYEWRFTGTHPGKLPEDYVKPGGNPEHGHRTDYTNM